MNAAAMPDYETVAILHAKNYLRVLHELNDNYLPGKEDQTHSLRNLDIELPNVLSARNRLSTLITRISIDEF